MLPEDPIARARIFAYRAQARVDATAEPPPELWRQADPDDADMARLIHRLADGVESNRRLLEELRGHDEETLARLTKLELSARDKKITKYIIWSAGVTIVLFGLNDIARLLRFMP